MRWACLAGVALASAAVGIARADPRLDEKVYDPYVESGVVEVEARSAGLVGAVGAQAASVYELEYGLNKHLSVALVGVESRPMRDADRWSSVGVEGVYYLGRMPKLGVDAALYLEYARGLNGEADKLEGKLLLARRAGRFEGLVNLIAERPLNARAGGNYASYGYAASATWRTVGDLRVGAEALGDFGSDHGLGGRQGAFVGPEVKWEVHPFGGRDLDTDADGDEPVGHAGPPIEIDVDAGWLAAVGADRSEAASQARVSVEVERKF
jgi:hypothetical protein